MPQDVDYFKKPYAYYVISTQNDKGNTFTRPRLSLGLIQTVPWDLPLREWHMGRIHEGRKSAKNHLVVAEILHEEKIGAFDNYFLYYNPAEPPPNLNTPFTRPNASYIREIFDIQGFIASRWEKPSSAEIVHLARKKRCVGVLKEATFWSYQVQDSPDSLALTVSRIQLVSPGNIAQIFGSRPGGRRTTETFTLRVPAYDPELGRIGIRFAATEDTDRFRATCDSFKKTPSDTHDEDSSKIPEHLFDSRPTREMVLELDRLHGKTPFTEKRFN